MATTIRSLVFVIMAFGAVNISAQSSDKGKVPVAVAHDGSDVVGLRLMAELRDVLGTRNGIRLSRIGQSDPTILVHISTMDMSVGGTGMMTAASIAIAYDSVKLPFLGLMLNAGVYGCGLSRVPSCARDIASHVENQLQKIRVDSPATWKTLTE